MASVSHFTVVRHGGAIIAHWDLSQGEGVVGFELYAGKHRLTAHLLRVHPSKTYGYRTNWRGGESFQLGIIMASGREIMIRPRG